MEGPASSTVRKRSVDIAGHRTSLSLEDAFWAELKRIARADGLTLAQLVARIDETRSGNLSSAARVYVLERLKAEAEAANSAPSPGE